MKKTSENPPCSWNGNINIVKMAILPKEICRFNPIPIKIPTEFFTDMGRSILNSLWIDKISRINPTIRNNERTSGEITISDHKLYYKVIVMKTWGVMGAKTHSSINGIESKTQKLSHIPIDT